MMIKCTKCGFENQMGAIFCRQCGEKIDMNQLSPESLEGEKQKEKRKEGIKKLIQRLFFFLILIIIVGGLAAVFIPIQTFEAPDTKKESYEKEKEAVIKKYSALSSEKSANISGTTELSVKDLNILYNEEIFPAADTAKKDEAANGEAASPEKADKSSKNNEFHVEHVSFSGDDGALLITIYAKCGFIPVNCRIKGIPKRGENDSEPVAFDVQYIHLGHLPIPCCRQKIVSMIGKTILTDEIKRIFKNASSVSMKKDEIVLHFGGAKAPGKEVKQSNPNGDESKKAAPAKKAKKKGKKKAKKD